MKTLPILAPLAFIASAALADPPAPAAPGTTVTVTGARMDPNQMICRSVRETGSRLAHNRVCQTRQEWDDQYRLSRQALERQQNQRSGSPSG